LRAGAVALAAKLAEGPTRALVATRALLEESGRNDYATQFRRELEVQNVMRDTADAREGRQAFVEKRPARFTGR
jgi:2-(1,2-epoxy-1,2-dihydrophenyl)acetyl-CoA isomerase